MILGARVKDPLDHKTLTINWATYLTSIVDTLTSVTWTITPTGLTTDAESHTPVLANIRVAGGTAGQTYEVANLLVTTSGEQKRVVIEVVVEE